MRCLIFSYLAICRINYVSAQINITEASINVTTLENSTAANSSFFYQAYKKSNYGSKKSYKKSSKKHYHSSSHSHSKRVKIIDPSYTENSATDESSITIIKVTENLMKLTDNVLEITENLIEVASNTEPATVNISDETGISKVITNEIDFNNSTSIEIATEVSPTEATMEEAPSNEIDSFNITNITLTAENSIEIITNETDASKISVEIATEVSPTEATMEEASSNETDSFNITLTAENSIEIITNETDASKISVEIVTEVSPIEASMGEASDENYSNETDSFNITNITLPTATSIEVEENETDTFNIVEVITEVPTSDAPFEEAFAEISLNVTNITLTKEVPTNASLSSEMSHHNMHEEIHNHSAPVPGSNHSHTNSQH